MHKRRWIVVALMAVFTINCNDAPYQLSTLYGEVTITEPVLINLLESHAIQRLKGVCQYGVEWHVKMIQQYNRYDHSVGVMVLLRIFGAPLLQQIAGLLHDASHGAFSHVLDHLERGSGGRSFREEKDAYQDRVHRTVLLQTDVPAILEKHGLHLDDVLHKSGTFTMLEQELPDLCADRFEYVLHGGYVEQFLSRNEIEYILAHTAWDGARWYFTDLRAARLYSNTALQLTEHTFGSAENNVIYYWLSRALRRALKIGLVTREQLHFQTDYAVIRMLMSSPDQKIQKHLERLWYYHRDMKVCDKDDAGAVVFRSKFRGVNPFVQTAEGLQRLADIDQTFAEIYVATRSRMATDRYLKLN